MGNTAIDALINSGADAMKNMYYVGITFPGADAAVNVSVRQKGVSIPTLSAAVYQKKYLGVAIDAPKSEQEGDRHFDITFRMDAAYGLYGAFRKWKSYVSDQNTASVANFAPSQGTLVIRSIVGSYWTTGAYDSAGADASTNNKTENKTEASSSSATSKTQQNTWTFKDVWVSKVTEPEFAVDSSDALEFTVTFHFGRCSYPAGYGTAT